MSIESLETELTYLKSTARAYAVSKLGNAYLDEILAKQSDERAGLVGKLISKRWFKNTPLWLKVELLVLPEEYNGFLEDLATRSSLIGDIEVVRLEKLARGNFGIIPVFKVRKPCGKEYTFEYMSWRHGPQSGVKGLILLQDKHEITHFLLLRGDTFATGKYEFLSVGGFIEKGEEGKLGASENFMREMREELGSPELKIVGEPINLGRLATDAGMTNNRPGLFACVMKNCALEALRPAPKNSDSTELPQRLVVHPIAQLKEVVMKNDDSFFLAAVARGWAAGVIPFPA